MKTCTKCKVPKSVDQFTKRSLAKGGLHSWCKTCASKARMASYYANPTVNRANGYARIKRNKEFVYKYLLGKKCIDCPESDIRVLQFDHVRGKKITEVSKMVHEGYSLDMIKKEIEKCEIRCANCHIKKDTPRMAP